MSDDLPIKSSDALPRHPVPDDGYDPYGGPGWEPAAAPEEAGLDWRRYLAALWRYKWLVLALTVLGSAAGVFLARQIKPEYEAQATIWIEASAPSVTRGGPIRTGGLLESGAWVDLLRSYVVLDAVVHELKLYVKPRRGADRPLFEGFELKQRVQTGDYRLAVHGGGQLFDLWGESERLLQRAAVGDSVGPHLGFRWVPPADELTPNREIEFSVASPRDEATSLGRRLRTGLDRNQTFLSLRLTGGNPEQLADILNTLSERYLTVAAELKSAKLDELTEILDEQLKYARVQLEEAEAELEAFRVQTVTLPQERAAPINPGLGITSGRAYGNYFSLQMEREGLRRDRESIARVLAAADTGLSLDGLEVVAAVRNSSDLMSALIELTNKRAELRAFRYRYSDEHEVVAGLLEEIEALERRSIPALARRLMGELSDREDELEELMSAASGELSEIPPRAIEEARLERKVRIAENLFTSLQARYEEARLAAVSSIPDIRVLDAAVPPRRPTNSDEGIRLVLMALMAGLGAGIAGAVLLDMLDPRLSYPDQVSAELGLTVLGTVPHVAARGARTGVGNTDEVIEAFRVIRLNLEHAYGSAGPLVVCITSPEPQDGKSFVAGNLGLTFADMGKRTLVIDADIRRGSLHRLFGGVRKPGLTDYLAGGASLDAGVQATRHGPLWYISSGTRRGDGPELLQSAAMPALLAQLRPHYDVILIDTPPLAAGVDPLAMGTMTGNVLIVLRTGATDKAVTEAKLDMLERLPLRVLGAVLNDTPSKGVYRYYRYRYASGYTAYDEEPPAPKPIESGSVAFDLREEPEVERKEEDETARPTEEEPRPAATRPQPQVIQPKKTRGGRKKGAGAGEPQASAAESAVAALDDLDVPPEAPPAAETEPAAAEPDTGGAGNGRGNGDTPSNGHLPGQVVLPNREVETVRGEAFDDAFNVEWVEVEVEEPNGGSNGGALHTDDLDARVEAFRRYQRSQHTRFWK